MDGDGDGDGYSKELDELPPAHLPSFVNESLIVQQQL